MHGSAEACDSELKGAEEIDTKASQRSQASSTHKRHLGDLRGLSLGGPHRVLIGYRGTEQKMMLPHSTIVPDA